MDLSTLEKTANDLSGDLKYIQEAMKSHREWIASNRATSQENSRRIEGIEIMVETTISTASRLEVEIAKQKKALVEHIQLVDDLARTQRAVATHKAALIARRKDINAKESALEEKEKTAKDSASASQTKADDKTMLNAKKEWEKYIKEKADLKQQNAALEVKASEEELAQKNRELEAKMTELANVKTELAKVTSSQQLLSEKEFSNLSAEKKQVETENQHLKRQKEQIQTEKEQLERENQQSATEKEALSRELQQLRLENKEIRAAQEALEDKQRALEDQRNELASKLLDSELEGRMRGRKRPALFSG